MSTSPGYAVAFPHPENAEVATTHGPTSAKCDKNVNGGSRFALRPLPQQRTSKATGLLLVRPGPTRGAP